MWGSGDIVLDHCPTTGLPLDDDVDALLALGLTRGDLAHLEDLSGREVLARLPLEDRRRLRRNRREDVVRYMGAWADLLEERLPVPAPAARPSPRSSESPSRNGLVLAEAAHGCSLPGA